MGQSEDMVTQTLSDPVVKQLLAQLETARRKLVEMGTRNRLIHVNRKTNRSNSINIVSERSDDVFRILKNDRKKMKFWATGTDRRPGDSEAESGEAGQLVLLQQGPERDEVTDEARSKDDRLKTKLGPDGQQKRLLKIFRDAKTAEEEQGINVLYLALGFLRWFEDANSDVEREAPLILLPVELVRNQRTSTYDLVIRDDEIVTNLPLREKLSREFGIQLPEIECSEPDEWTPGSYFDQIDEVIEAKDRWSIDRDGIQLGFFSFAKLLMLLDLQPDNWPDGGLLNSSLLSSLLNSTFEADSPIFGDEDNLDEKLDPSDMLHVLDADRSQAIVIEEVRKGRNLVVQGPPGTGKSQTITNIIAAAVHDGKKVLFVAEKMAALSVVHDRLRKTGMEHVALELHSKAANKRKVLEELGRTLNEGAAVAGAHDNPESVRVPRDKLNAIVNALHKSVDGSTLSPFQAMAVMSAMKGKSAPAPSIDGKDLANLSEESLETLCNQIADLGTLLASDKTHSSNPFRGTGNTELQPLDLERIAVDARQIGDIAKKLADNAEKFRLALGIDANTIASIELTCLAMEHASKAPPQADKLVPRLFEPSGNPAFFSALDDVINWIVARKESPFAEAAIAVPAGDMRMAIGAGMGSIFGRLGSRYRSASNSLATLLKGKLPSAAAERVALVDMLIELQSINERFRRSEPVLRDMLDDAWSDDEVQLKMLKDAATYIREFQNIVPKAPVKTLTILSSSGSKTAPIAAQIGSLVRQIKAQSDSVFDLLKLDRGEAFGNSSLDDISLSHLAARLENMGQEQSRYDSWRRYCELRASLMRHQLDDLVVRMEQGLLPRDAALNEVKYARAEAAWKVCRDVEPALNALGDIPRHELVQQFMGAERDRMKTVRKVVASNHLGRVPAGAVGEMGFVRSQIARKRGHAPIRKLIQTAGLMIQKIRPVFLMSPISVAQFLPPESVEFDLLIIDEASQVKPEDAFGAIARSKQVVIVGDQKQLPPTAFFDKMTSNSDSDDDDDERPLAGYATEAESILSLCDSRQLPSRMLSWHYRSRDPSLIKVSNVEFYDHKLVLPPSPLENDMDYGLRFLRVDGVYTPKSGVESKPGTNLIEAEYLVEAVKEHARNTPDLSLGIATFNISQRDCINEVLERERRKDDILDDFLREGRIEDVFVKNIENVQGDERDVIMISVGYGPRMAGQRLASTNFGPVNKEGGHRRLNVLFSRARVRCDVFCSFEPGDISVDGKSDGVRVFKRYLEFAKTGIVDEALAKGGLPDSPFESDVAAYVRDLGYSVDHQVGSGGFLIDLGVIHPKCRGQYMLAIECDGATYHSSLWSRERDRLRQEVLEHLGWRFHRIWSTDWFFRREKEKERLRHALETSAKESNLGASISGANKGTRPRQQEVDRKVESKPAAPVILKKPKTLAVPYMRATVHGDTRVEPHEASPALANKLVAEIVLHEGPIHQDEVARRYASAFGKQKAGGRIIDTALRALNRQKEKQLVSDDPASTLLAVNSFWMTEYQKATPPVRNRSNEAGTSLFKAEMISPMEIARAAELIVEECGSVSLDELVRNIAREFGYDRTGPELRAVIEESAKFASADSISR